MKTVAVVGSGASGVASAFALQAAGYQVVMLEATKNLGGRMGDAYLGDRRIDFGGKNIGRNYPLFRQFAETQLPVHYEFFGINSASVRNGRLYRIDSESRLKTLLNMVDLIGPMNFLRIARLAWAVRRDPENAFLGGPYFRRVAQRYDHAPMSTYFGDQCLRHLLRPMTVRMNGAEPDEYYLGNIGSNIKMILDRYDQIKEGLHTVLDAFFESITVMRETVVDGLLMDGKRVVGLRATQRGKSVDQFYDGVVVGVPAHDGARMLPEALSPLRDLLNGINYHPVAVAVVQYDRPVFPGHTRAVVFSDDHIVSNAGAYGAEDRNIVRYTFSGRAFRENISVTTPIEEMLAMAEADLSPFFPDCKQPRLASVYRYFQTGLCAYGPYYPQFLDSVDSHLSAVSGLALAGDYIRGGSIEACFRSGYEAAERLGAVFRPETLRTAL